MFQVAQRRTSEGHELGKVSSVPTIDLAYTRYSYCVQTMKSKSSALLQKNVRGSLTLTAALPAEKVKGRWP